MQDDLSESSYRVKQRMTLQQFIVQESMDLTLSAIAVNGCVIPREEYELYMLHECDCVHKIVAFAGG